MACAITAAKLNIPVAHVEAGLRSFDRSMPEEINRIVTDAVSNLLFVSEPSGLSNLDHEGVPASKIHYVGNVMIDSLIHELPAAGQMNIRAVFGLEPHEYALVTLHRPSNVDNVQRSNELLKFLLDVSKELPIVFPMHPRTRKRLSAAGLMEQLSSNPRITILEPVGYRENLGLMMSAKVVLTDSGGMQEETSFLGIPCLTLRSNTERPVTITHGTNTLVGDDLGGAYQEFANILAGVHRPSLPITGWDGHAAERIATILDTNWNGAPVA
jgi:UDP-N-acetylglucosamine 2-epimerase (non-hydrolysing)